MDNKAIVSSVSVWVILVVTLSACVERKPVIQAQATDAIELQEATYMHWVAGVPGGGRGTEIRITLAVRTQHPVVFEKVLVEDEEFPFIVKRKGDPVSTTLVVPAFGDTLDIRVSIVGGPKADPFKVSLEFTAGGSMQTFPISDFEKLETQYRP